MNRLALTVSLVVSSAAFAEVPERIAYQGRLVNADGTPLGSGTSSAIKKLTFSIFDDATAGHALWSEEQALALTEVSPGVHSIVRCAPR